MFIICYVFINKTSRLQFWVFSRNSSYWGSKITDWLTQLNWCDSVNEMRRAKLLHQTSFLPPVDPTALIPTNTPSSGGWKEGVSFWVSVFKATKFMSQQGEIWSRDYDHLNQFCSHSNVFTTGWAELHRALQPSDFYVAAEQPWKHGITASWHF